MSVLTAYVDGSCKKDVEYSYGIVLIDNGKVIHEEFAKFNDDARSMRNVAGELKGAMKAIFYARKMGYSSLIIHYDYKGIEKWATREWKAKNEYTQKYRTYVDSARKNMRIQFVHVKAHTGDTYNERADELAKEALDIKKK